MVLALALTVVLAMAFTACGGDGGSSGSSGNSGGGGGGDDSGSSDAYKVFAAATEAMSNADAISYDLDLDINMVLSGSDYGTKMVGSMTQTKTDGNYELYANLDVEMLGTSLAMEEWYKDGYMYISMSGYNYKQAMSLEDYMKSMQGSSVQTFPESSIKDYSKESVSEGTKYTFTVDGAAMKEMVWSNMEANAETLGLTEADLGMSDATISVVVDGNDLISYSMLVSYKMTISGEEVTADMDLTVSNITIGGVTVTFPADMDSYQELAA
jgi:hypothetical protein